jgi:hypothetical protein
MVIESLSLPDQGYKNQGNLILKRIKLFVLPVMLLKNSFITSVTGKQTFFDNSTSMVLAWLKDEGVF